LCELLGHRLKAKENLIFCERCGLVYPILIPNGGRTITIDGTKITFPDATTQSSAGIAAGDDILERLQKHLGLWWFCNHWRPTDLLATGKTGSAYIKWIGQYAELATGTTTSSWVNIEKEGYGLAGNYTWDKKRYFSVRAVVFYYSNQYIHIISGLHSVGSSANTNPHIGFKVINDSLYGTVGDGTYESTLLLETLTATVTRRLECILDPAVPECKFFVDGVEKGTITTSLPTGTSQALRLFRTSIYNLEAANKVIRITEARCFQEE